MHTRRYWNTSSQSRVSPHQNYLINAVEHLSITPEDCKITLNLFQTAQCRKGSFTHLLMAAVQHLVHLQMAVSVAAAAVADVVY